MECHIRGRLGCQIECKNICTYIYIYMSDRVPNICIYIYMCVCKTDLGPLPTKTPIWYGDTHWHANLDSVPNRSLHSGLVCVCVRSNARWKVWKNARWNVRQHARKRARENPQTECRMPDKCQIECQIGRQIGSRRGCQNTCQKFCQTDCQNIYHMECHLVGVTRRKLLLRDSGCHILWRQCG